MQIFGVRLIGFTTENAHKLVLTAGFIAGILVLRFVLVTVVRAVTGDIRNERAAFWTRQVSSLVTAALVVLAVASIWFDNPAKYGTALGVFSAGLAFALQKVVTAFAAYLMIVRSRIFRVGDRISMGGVRGDVIALGFFQTRILEMGEPPSMQGNGAGTWVVARQFTGRVVSVTNDKVFDTPVFNYTRDFPFIYEEMHIPIPFSADRRRAEQILVDAATRSTADIRAGSGHAMHRFEEKYSVQLDDTAPRVFYRITDNWVEMTVRFIAPQHGVREVKDAMSREILDRLDRAGIGIASGTYDIVSLPPLKLDAGSVGDALSAVQAIRKDREESRAKG